MQAVLLPMHMFHISSSLIYFSISQVHLFIFQIHLQDCQLSVRQVNPRQYVAEIPQVCAYPFQICWFHQEFKDVVSYICLLMKPFVWRTIFKKLIQVFFFNVSFIVWTFWSHVDAYFICVRNNRSCACI